MTGSPDSVRVSLNNEPIPVRLTADLTVDGDQTVIRLAGDLDLAAAPDLVTVASAAVDRADLRTLLLDLAAVEFMDSTGLGALVRARTLCQDNHAELRLRAVGPRVRQLLALTNMTSTFGLCNGDGGRC